MRDNVTIRNVPRNEQCYVNCDTFYEILNKTKYVYTTQICDYILINCEYFLLNERITYADMNKENECENYKTRSGKLT